TNMIESGGNPTSIPEEIRNQVVSKVDWSKWTAAIAAAKPSSTKKATSTQYQAAGYATRIEEAEVIFEDLADYINNVSTFELIKQKKLPNNMRSLEYQRLEQAQRNFVNAKLRDESGAAIAPSEFESAALQYFIQPGDRPEVIDQKRSNRKTVLQGLINEAGSAYTGGGNISGAIPSGDDLLREQVIGIGYDYDALSSQYSDEEIKESIYDQDGIQL
ncbi:hypothetical protein LCGC14_2912200, partial [marine sediment metagenome]